MRLADTTGVRAVVRYEVVDDGNDVGVFDRDLITDDYIAQFDLADLDPDVAVLIHGGRDQFTVGSEFDLLVFGRMADQAVGVQAQGQQNHETDLMHVGCPPLEGLFDALRHGLDMRSQRLGVIRRREVPDKMFGVLADATLDVGADLRLGHLL